MVAEVKEMAVSSVEPTAAAIVKETSKLVGPRPKKQPRSRSEDTALNQPKAAPKLKEFMPSYPETFKFKKIGASIEGIFSRIKAVYPEGDKRELIVIHTRNGPRTVWLNTQLCSKIHDALDEGALYDGAYIKIELIGYRQSTKDARYCYEEYKILLEE